MKKKYQKDDTSLERSTRYIKCTAAAAAKSLQSCLTLCDPMNCSPPGSSLHEIFQARVLEWGAIAFSDIKCTHLCKTQPRGEACMQLKHLT